MEHLDRDPCSACVSRRAILRAGAGAGACAALATLPTLPLAGCTSQPSGPIAAGNVADTQVGMLRALGGNEVILARDARGLYALTQLCSHQGEPVSVVTGGATPVLHCYRHGSEFDMEGEVTHGPATRPLDHFKVEVTADGSITVRADLPASADDRTSPVPA